MRKILKVFLATVMVFSILTVTVCADDSEGKIIDSKYGAPKPAVTTAPEKEADVSDTEIATEESIMPDESTGVWSTDPSEMDGYLSDETFGNLFGSLMSEDLFNQAPETGEPLEEEGNAYTRDLLYDKDCHKQFITVQTRAGNTFYIVIDYDAPINEKEEQYQVYFLNMVDDEDLLSLLDEAPSEKIPECSCKEKCVLGKVNAKCDVCKNDLNGCKGIEPEPPKEEEPEPEAPPIESEPETPAKKNNIFPMLGVIAVIAVGGLAFYYIKFVKGRKTEDDEELYDNEGYEEEYVNEDEGNYNETEDDEDDNDELTDEDEQQ